MVEIQFMAWEKGVTRRGVGNYEKKTDERAVGVLRPGNGKQQRHRKHEPRRSRLNCKAPISQTPSGGGRRAHARSPSPQTPMPIPTSFLASRQHHYTLFGFTFFTITTTTSSQACPSKTLLASNRSQQHGAVKTTQNIPMTQSLGASPLSSPISSSLSHRTSRGCRNRSPSWERKGRQRGCASEYGT